MYVQHPRYKSIDFSIIFREVLNWPWDVIFTMGGGGGDTKRFPQRIETKIIETSKINLEVDPHYP